MSDNTRVSGSLEVKPSSREAVAFDLLLKITSHEVQTGLTKDRDYWLTLYRQCYKATCGFDLAHILAKD